MAINYKGYPKKMVSGKDNSQKYHEEGYKDKMHSNAYANMPEEKIMEEYPKQKIGLDSFYNDNILGIDKFADMNDKQMKKQLNKPYEK